MVRESLSAVNVLRELTEAASQFVDKAPRQKRLEADRQALLDALTRAQLVLSVGGRKLDEPQSDEVVPGKDWPTEARTPAKSSASRKRKS
jgi:hypothetical protein